MKKIELKKIKYELPEKFSIVEHKNYVTITDNYLDIHVFTMNDEINEIQIVNSDIDMTIVGKQNIIFIGKIKIKYDSYYLDINNTNIPGVRY
jgi:hypothetical protein